MRSIARFDDLIGVNLIAPLLLGIQLVTAFSILRIPLGLVLLLFCPGYALAALLYPRSRDLETVERIVLSLGLSVAVLTIVGILLNFSPWGITRLSVVLGLGMVTAALSVGVVVRRGRLGLPALYRVDLRLSGRGWGAFWGRHWVAVSGLALVGAVAWAGARLTAPTRDFTEFFVVGDTAKAGGYPKLVIAGQPIDLVVGIANHEGRMMTYRAQVRADSTLLARLDHITLAPGGRWTHAVRLVLHSPEPRRLDLVLFREGSDTPYRILTIHVDVLPASRGQLQTREVKWCEA